MAFYDWKCEKCNKEEETMSSISNKKAPICCSQEMRQVFSKPGILPGALRSGYIS